MIRICFVFALTLYWAPSSEAADVQSLIKSNSETLSLTTSQIKRRAATYKIATEQAPVAGADLPEMRVWPHVRNAQQGDQIRRLLARLRPGVPVNGSDRGVDVQEIQLVERGPLRTQVRFFKPLDADSAQALATWLSDHGVVAQVKDLSEQFKDQSWIKLGHTEIWLAEDR